MSCKDAIRPDTLQWLDAAMPGRYSSLRRVMRGPIQNRILQNHVEQVIKCAVHDERQTAKHRFCPTRDKNQRLSSSGCHGHQVSIWSELIASIRCLVCLAPNPEMCCFIPRRMFPALLHAFRHNQSQQR